MNSLKILKFLLFLMTFFTFTPLVRLATGGIIYSLSMTDNNVILGVTLFFIYGFLYWGYDRAYRLQIYLLNYWNNKLLDYSKKFNNDPKALGRFNNILKGFVIISAVVLFAVIMIQYELIIEPIKNYRSIESWSYILGFILFCIAAIKNRSHSVNIN
jgi:hypothetical protein